MSRSGRFTFTLPESFQRLDYLKDQSLWRYADDARYFVHLILTKMSHGKANCKHQVRLKAEYLMNVMSQRHYRDVIDSLLKNGAIERDSYKPGKHSFRYSLHPRFLNDKHVRFPVTNPMFLDRLDKYQQHAEDKQIARMKPIHFELETRQRLLEIDGDLAREILSKLPPESNPFDVQGVLVSNIENRDFRLNVGRYGRVSNNITNMKREVRKALRFHGRPLVCIDIKSCQPSLLLKLIKKQGDKQPTNSKGSTIYDSTPYTPKGVYVALYKCLIQNGRLYEFMWEKLKASGTAINRDVVKKRILSDVFAKKKLNESGAEYPSKVERIFERWFPPVYAFIRDFNAEGWEHENLARELQRQESSLVIETICGDLVRRFPEIFIVTLHDSIYCLDRDVKRVKKAFRRAFKKCGIPMQISIQ